MIIDEIQKAPILMEAIKKRIDEAKLKNVKKGKTTDLMYILTGSNAHEICEMRRRLWRAEQQSGNWTIGYRKQTGILN